MTLAAATAQTSTSWVVVAAAVTGTATLLGVALTAWWTGSREDKRWAREQRREDDKYRRDRDNARAVELVAAAHNFYDYLSEYNIKLLRVITSATSRSDIMEDFEISARLRKLVPYARASETVAAFNEMEPTLRRFRADLMAELRSRTSLPDPALAVWLKLRLGEVDAASLALLGAVLTEVWYIEHPPIPGGDKPTVSRLRHPLQRLSLWVLRDQLPAHRTDTTAVEGTEGQAVPDAGVETPKP